MMQTISLNLPTGGAVAVLTELKIVVFKRFVFIIMMSDREINQEPVEVISYE